MHWVHHTISVCVWFGAGNWFLSWYVRECYRWRVMERCEKGVLSTELRTGAVREHFWECCGKLQKWVLSDAPLGTLSDPSNWAVFGLVLSLFLLKYSQANLQGMDSRLIFIPVFIYTYIHLPYLWPTIENWNVYVHFVHWGKASTIESYFVKSRI